MISYTRGAFTRLSPPVLEFCGFFFAQLLPNPFCDSRKGSFLSCVRGLCAPSGDITWAGDMKNGLQRAQSFISLFSDMPIYRILDI
jgi:hypothetical protein